MNTLKKFIQNAAMLAAPSVKKIVISNPTMIAFTITAGKGPNRYRTARCLDFPIHRVKMAAINEAKVPNNTSHITVFPKDKPIILASRQPTVNPGIADGVYIGSTVNASLNLSCTAPYANWAITKVSTAYMAAIKDADTN